MSQTPETERTSESPAPAAMFPTTETKRTLESPAPTKAQLVLMEKLPQLILSIAHVRLKSSEHRLIGIAMAYGQHGMHVAQLVVDNKSGTVVLAQESASTQWDALLSLLRRVKCSWSRACGEANLEGYIAAPYVVKL
ncbi:hypothetical protein EJ04DRAFT_61234 [Polyplosphaeria fusca]|uniref:Uncharacterized protein n=1 Tax=Polyplosphaeria fusca TaxID=682080 RepID=A0A9P4V7C2_9PLEO|nr:hypothetical protein EJ04DRAFT_61234 [Polyplosphaeria fusca]